MQCVVRRANRTAFAVTHQNGAVADAHEHLMQRMKSRSMCRPLDTTRSLSLSLSLVLALSLSPSLSLSLSPHGTKHKDTHKNTIEYNRNLFLNTHTHLRQLKMKKYILVSKL